MVFKEGTFHGKPPERPDEVGPAALESRVAEALALDGNLDASDIAVFASAAEEVTLTGSVSTRAEADHAVEIARSVEGVHVVDNKISIGSAPGVEQVATIA